MVVPVVSAVPFVPVIVTSVLADCRAWFATLWADAMSERMVVMPWFGRIHRALRRCDIVENGVEGHRPAAERGSREERSWIVARHIHASSRCKCAFATPA